MRRDGSPATLRRALAAGRGELALYVGAGLAYVAIGVASPEFLFSWVVGATYLVTCVVLLPALLRRFRR